MTYTSGALEVINSDIKFISSSICDISAVDAGSLDSFCAEPPEWDLLGNYRIWDGNGDALPIIDMGAYEYGSVGVAIDENQNWISASSISCFPNPSKGEVSFRFNFPSDEDLRLMVFDQAGRLVIDEAKEIRNNSDAGMKYNFQALPGGIYFYRISTIDNRQSTMGKLILAR